MCSKSHAELGQAQGEAKTLFSGVETISIKFFIHANFSFQILICVIIVPSVIAHLAIQIDDRVLPTVFRYSPRCFYETNVV